MSKSIIQHNKNLVNDLTFKQQKWKDMLSVQKYFKTNQELVRETLKLLVERK